MSKRRIALSKRRIALLTTILFLTLACLVSSVASATTTLGDLVSDPNANLMTPDGVLTFENFDVTLTLTLAPVYNGNPNILAGLNLDIFEVEVFDSSFGFRILELDGPISAFAGTIGNMVIEFDVVASDGW